MSNSEQLAHAQGVFADWRMERKTKTEATPERLWGLAISLLKEHSITEVARALGVNATTLKKKAKASSPQSAMITPGKQAVEKPTFFETRMDAISVRAGETGSEPQRRCLIQIRRRDGAQMNIHQGKLTSAELCQLISGFCG